MLIVTHTNLDLLLFCFVCSPTIRKCTQYIRIYPGAIFCRSTNPSWSFSALAFNFRRKLDLCFGTVLEACFPGQLRLPEVLAQWQGAWRHDRNMFHIWSVIGFPPSLIVFFVVCIMSLLTFEGSSRARWDSVCVCVCVCVCYWLNNNTYIVTMDIFNAHPPLELKALNNTCSNTHTKSSCQGLCCQRNASPVVMCF